MSGLRLSPLDFVRYKEMPHGFDAWCMSFLGVAHVPKRPTFLLAGTSRNAPQATGGNHRRAADRSTGWQSDALSISRKRARPHANSSSPNQSKPHSHVSNEAPRF